MTKCMFQANGIPCPKCGGMMILTAQDDTGLLIGTCPYCQTEGEKRPDDGTLREIQKA